MFNKDVAGLFNSCSGKLAAAQGGGVQVTAQAEKFGLRESNLI